MISVVINTYNAEEHLAECLEAVKDFDEIVVCDMESTDHTVEIGENEPIYRWRSGEKGQPRLRNLCLVHPSSVAICRQFLLERWI